MEVVVAAISVGISVVALVVSIVVARRQTAIQERLAAVEEARRAEEIEARTRARVTASFEREGEPRLMLRNEGPALARNVEVELEERSTLRRVIGLEALPVDLQPGQAMTFQAIGAWGAAMTFRVTVRWTDEAGEHEEPYTLSTR